MGENYKLWLDLELKDYYYSKAIYMDNTSPFRIYLEAETKNRDSILVFLNQGPVSFMTTEESSRIDWEDRGENKKIFYKVENSRYIDFILANNYGLFDREDLGHYVIVDLDNVTDIVSRDEPGLIFYDKNYVYDDYSCDCEDCLYFYENFSKRHGLAVSFLKSLGIDFANAFELSSFEDEEGKKSYLAHYLLKGDILEDTYSMNIGDLNIDFISHRVEETFWPSPDIEGPYLILEIDNIVL